MGDLVESEFPQLLEDIKRNVPSLTKVEIKRGLAWFSQKHLKELLTSLAKNLYVTDLSLGNLETDEDCNELAQFLGNNNSVAVLDLRFAGLSEKNAKMIYDVLKKKALPIKVELMGNNISPELTKDFLNLNPKSTQHSVQSSIPKTSSTTDIDLSEKTKEELIREVELLRSQFARQSKLLESLNRPDPTKKSINLKNLQVTQKLADVGGSHATVYACLVDGWQCVMKELNLEGMKDNTIKQFESEIRLLENMPYHPNIIRYLFFERKGNRLRLYVTQYSTSLKTYILSRREQVNENKEELFTPSQIAKWASEIVTGLDFLHTMKIVHRDLKSDNVFVLLDAHNEIMQLAIGDFDTAKRITKNKQAKTVIGTPSYMAPEVFNAKPDAIYGYSADVWSFGMVLYEMMTLMQPYEQENHLSIALLVVEGIRPSLPDDLPEEYDPLIKIFEDCTELEPNDRPTLASIKTELLQLRYS